MSKDKESKKVGQSKEHYRKDYRSVRFPLDLYAAMEEIANSNDRPTSWEFRRAIEQYIQQKREEKD